MVRTACSSVWSCQLFLKQNPSYKTPNYHPPHKVNNSPFNLCYNVPDTCLDSNPLKPESDARIRQALSDFKKENGMDLNKSQSVYFFFFFNFSLPCSFPCCCFFLKQNWCQIFALMWALPQTSWAVRVAGVAPEKLLCESLQPCVKGKHVLHSESQGSLSHLISEMKCFPPPALTIQASALAQTNPSRVACTCDDATMALRKRLFFLGQAPLWVLLVWFADNSHVGEHVVHVCSI